MNHPHLARRIPARDSGPAATDRSAARQDGRFRASNDGGPTGVFVAIEMAVLVVVAALAMTSIIVSAGCSGLDDQRDGVASRTTTTQQAATPRVASR